MHRRLALFTTLLAGVLVHGQDVDPRLPHPSLRRHAGGVEVAMDRLQAIQARLGMGRDHDVQPTQVFEDDRGVLHTRFQQRYRGLRILGGDGVIHHDQLGAADEDIAQRLYRGIRLAVEPLLTHQEALAKAHGHMAPKATLTLQPTWELVVVPQKEERLKPGHRGDNALDYETVTQGFRLAYRCVLVVMAGSLDTREREYLVDAHTGEILQATDLVQYESAEGAAKTRYSGTVKLNANKLSSGTFELRDTVQATGSGIWVSNKANSEGDSTGTIFTDADNVWGDGVNYTGGSTTSANGQTAAADVAYGLQTSYRLWREAFGRKGLDGAGRGILGRVHYGSNYNNAFWSPALQCVTFGDGDVRVDSFANGGTSMSRVSIDTVSHELGHGLNNHSAQLNYSGEAGGLNEANSDILAMVTQIYSQAGFTFPAFVPNTHPAWTYSEESRYKPLRYFYKPSLDGKSPNVWSSTLKDTDVHYSSGPMNRAFFFLSQGASATSTSSYYSSLAPKGFSGIGPEAAAKIHFRALTAYFTSGTTYAGARSHYLKAATDLYGATSAQYRAVQNAFAAIAVGSLAPDESGNPPVVVTLSPAPTAEAVEGTTIDFKAFASGGSGTYSTFRWLLQGNPISGATSPTFAYTAKLADHQAKVMCRVTDSTKAEGTSAATMLSVYGPLQVVGPSAQSAGVGDTVTFEVKASGGKSPYTYQWQRNGTDLPKAMSASLSYVVQSADDGAAFRCIVLDAMGKPQTVTSSAAQLTVANQPPVADFTWNASQRTVAFTDASRDADGTVVQWSWTFGDGQTSTLQNPSHTFAEDRSYTVSLTVTDDRGGTHTHTQSVAITNQPPVAAFSVSVDQLKASFFDQSTDADGKVVEWQWSFGDQPSGAATSSQQHPTFTYPVAGTYTATLRVKDSAGTWSPLASRSVTVKREQEPNQPPVAGFTLSTNKLSAAFADASTDPDGKVVSWMWNFGDGNTSTLQNPAHTYAKPGSYTATLTVTDDQGATATSRRELTAVANQEPVAEFTFAVNGLTATFANASKDPDGSVVSSAWTFGLSGSSSAANPSFTFPAAGTYDVTLVVKDNDGATSSITKPVKVEAPSGQTLAIVQQPKALTVKSGQTASFSVVATGATSYQWYRQDINGTRAIVGATTAAYSFKADWFKDNGASFWVVIKDASGKSLTSAKARLTVGIF